MKIKRLYYIFCLALLSGIFAGCLRSEKPVDDKEPPIVNIPKILYNINIDSLEITRDGYETGSSFRIFLKRTGLNME
jgi:hypothetical protein